MSKSHLEEIIKTELRHNGLRILAENTRILGIEVDLVVQTPNREVWLIEIKSPFLPLPKPKQKQRQKRLLNQLCLRFPQTIIRYHVITQENGQLVWFWDYLGD